MSGVARRPTIKSREWILEKRRSPRLMRRAGFPKLFSLAGRTVSKLHSKFRKIKPQSAPFALCGPTKRKDSRRSGASSSQAFLE